MPHDHGMLNYCEGPDQFASMTRVEIVEAESEFDRWSLATLGPTPEMRETRSWLSALRIGAVLPVPEGWYM